MESSVRAQCCIVGGGPAGVMLGLLLARAGVTVLVLEKHADFLRDFRGDTIHPSTLDVMHELGILDEFLQRPHQEIQELSGQIGPDTVPFADFTRLPTRRRCLVLMPQWDFLSFLVEKAKGYPTFRIEMQAEVFELFEELGRVAGVRFRGPHGSGEVRADLVVGADGRQSVVRSAAKLPLLDIGAPIDVLWMRISRLPTDAPEAFGHVEPGRILVRFDRGDYWQCAYAIAKGEAASLMKGPIEAFRQEILKLTPSFGPRVQELRSWDDVFLLTVRVDRLEKWWRAGLLCIGDAAHAMSPIGGVGINLAIQDAVATANLLGHKLRQGAVTDADLQAVQTRRMFPTRATQALQVAIQNNVLRNILGTNKPIRAPWLLKLASRSRLLRGVPARVFGVGFRPEHVAS